MYYFMSLSLVGPAFWVAMVLVVYFDKIVSKAFECTEALPYADCSLAPFRALPRNGSIYRLTGLLGHDTT